MTRYKLEVQHDSFAEDPCTIGDREWKVYSFLRKHARTKERSDFFIEAELSLCGELNDDEDNQPYEPEQVGVDRDVRELLTLGLAQLLDYREHGLGEWSTCGPGPYDEREIERADGIIIWEHPVEDIGCKTVAQCTAAIREFLEVYNNWCNGNCYAFRLTDVDHGSEDGWRGGIYGEEQLYEALNEELRSDDIIVAIDDDDAHGMFERRRLPCLFLPDAPEEDETRL